MVTEATVVAGVTTGAMGRRRHPDLSWSDLFQLESPETGLHSGYGGVFVSP